MLRLIKEDLTLKTLRQSKTKTKTKTQKQYGFSDIKVNRLLATAILMLFQLSSIKHLNSVCNFELIFLAANLTLNERNSLCS